MDFVIVSHVLLEKTKPEYTGERRFRKYGIAYLFPVRKICDIKLFVNRVPSKL